MTQSPRRFFQRPEGLIGVIEVEELGKANFLRNRADGELSGLFMDLFNSKVNIKNARAKDRCSKSDQTPDEAARSYKPIEDGRNAP